MNAVTERMRPRILSIGTSHPPRGYSQEDLLELFQVTDPKAAGIFRNSHIQNRYLYLPDADAGGKMRTETTSELAAKHRDGAIAHGSDAIRRALDAVGLSVRDIDYFVCVTSTGFLCPSLTAHLIAALGLRADIHRADIVGMGCNAGLNALQPLVNYCALNPGKIGLQLCVEMCSAAYVFDESLRTSVVNCLFGDAAVATILCAEAQSRTRGGPSIIGFSSHIIPEAIDAMRFDYDGLRYSFYLDKEIPYVIGQNVGIPVDAVLGRYGLKRRDVSHWAVHSGGKKVIDSIKYSLGLSDHDVRHTQSVLRDYGNVSSGSFLFTLDRLHREGQVRTGEYILMMTMGPGSTIECCLGRF